MAKRKTAIESDAQKKIQEALQLVTNPGVAESTKRVIDILTEFKDVDGVVDTIEEQANRTATKELKAKGAKTVIWVDGKACCFREMGMDEFIQLADEIGEKGFENLTNGKVGISMLKGFKFLYWELIMKDISDPIFHKDGEAVTTVCMRMESVMGFAKKKVLAL